MLRIAIVDDKKIFLDIMKRKTVNIFNEYEIDFTVCDFNNGESFLREHKQEVFDVVFLDIIMPQNNGFKVAQEIRRKSTKTYIIFVTTEDQLIYDSFDFQPFFFLPKDKVEIFDVRLEHTIERLLIHMSVNKSLTLELPRGEKIVVSPSDIVFIGSKSNYIIYLLTDKRELYVRKKLDSTLLTLPESLFVRIHNRYIVNLKHITRIDYSNSICYLDIGGTLPISRTYKQSLEMSYLKYLEEFEL